MSEQQVTEILALLRQIANDVAAIKRLHERASETPLPIVMKGSA